MQAAYARCRGLDNRKRAVVVCVLLTCLPGQVRQALARVLARQGERC